MACRSEKTTQKDRVINSYAPKRQGQIKTFNSFNPLTKFDLTCSFCYNNGHYEQNFPLKGRKTSSKIFAMDKCGLALFAQNNGNQWFVDSGCSRHMTGDRRKFISLSKKEGNVSFGSGTGKIAGKGTVTLINGKGKAQDALLVDGLKQNLLSVSQIFDQGHKVVFSTKDCEIRNYASGKLLAKGVRTPDNFYVLNKIQENKCYLSQADESWLWHKRLGHTSFDNLVNISKIKAVQDIPRFSKPKQAVCGPCQHGKQTRTSHKTKEHCTSKPLEIVHADVCGPTINQALQGERYFVLFVDDYTRMMWIYFIKYKSETFECFKNLKALIENKKDSKIKCLRKHIGGEFTSNEFSEFCNFHGIKREFSAARTPQQNGVVERRNRTVQEMARTMLFAAYLQPKLWKEAVGTTIYTMNRTQLRPNCDKTPYELWKGRPATLKYFKIFGSKCFIKINDGSPRKFDSRVDEGIFLGYSPRSKAYKCYNF